MNDFAIAGIVAGGIAVFFGAAVGLRSALGLRAAALRLRDHAFVRTASSTTLALKRAAAAGVGLDAARLAFTRSAAALDSALASATGYGERVAVIAVSIDAALDLLVPKLRGSASKH